MKSTGFYKINSPSFAANSFPFHLDSPDSRQTHSVSPTTLQPSRCTARGRRGRSHRAAGPAICLQNFTPFQTEPLRLVAPDKPLEEGEGPAAAGRVAEGRADSRSRPVPRSPQAPTWQGTAPSAPQRPRAPSGKGAERASRTGLWLPRGGAGAPGNIPDCAVVMAAPLKKFTRTNWTALGESSSSKAVAQRSNDRSVLATAETITTKGDEGTFGVHLNWGSVYRGAQSLKQNGALNWTRPGQWHHRQAAPMRLVKTPRSCPRA